MKPNYAHISFLLDRSGSMDAIATDTIGGFNAFLHQQAAVPGEATVTLAEFDDRSYDVLYAMRPIASAPELTAATFVPRGATPLVDSLARIIDETGAALSALPEDQRPSNVYIVILSDGLENASKLCVMRREDLNTFTIEGRRDTRRVVGDLIRQQQDQYKWQFLYLGCNQDAISVGTSYGFTKSASLNFVASGQGVRAAYAVAAAGLTRSRTSLQDQSVSFTDQERAEAMGTPDNIVAVDHIDSVV
jgi:hypothetical protein